MLVKEAIKSEQITFYLNRIIRGQTGFEQNLDKKHRKQNGVFLTNSLLTVENILSIVEINIDISLNAYLSRLVVKEFSF